MDLRRTATARAVRLLLILCLTTWGASSAMAQCNRTITADVVALDQAFFWNRLRAQLASLESLLDRFAPRAVVIVTSAVDPQACFTALRHGVSGIVLKARGEETLLDAMTSAARGQVLLERAVLTEILSDVAQLPDVPSTEQAKIDQLTPREREIAEVACTGLTNKQIAEKLAISEATVRHHLGVIFSKLGVSTRSELTGYGYRHHLVGSRTAAEGASPADTIRN